MPPVEIRPSTVDDLDAVAQLDQDLFGPEAWSRDTHRDELTSPFRSYLSVVDEGELVGWGGVILAEISDLLTIGVARSHQRRGIGTRLLAALVDEAARGGAREIFLEVRADDDGAQRLYALSGFTAVALRPNYYPSTRSDAVVMRRTLFG